MIQAQINKIRPIRNRPLTSSIMPSNICTPWAPSRRSTHIFNYARADLCTSLHSEEPPLCERFPTCILKAVMRLPLRGRT